MTARKSRASAPGRAPRELDPPPSRLQSAPGWSQHLVAIALLAVALAAVFPEIALQGRVFTSPDYDSPSYFGAAGRAALASGAYPLWNPYLFLGMPSFASLAFTPWIYPPTEILSALGKLPLAPPLLWLLVYQLAAGYGVFLVLRALRAAVWAAILGGAVFMLTPHLVSMGVFGHGSKLASVSYLPYLLLLGLRLREAGRRPLWTALLGLALGLQLLRGHPQIAYYGLLMLGLLVLVEFVAMLRRRVPRREFGRLAAGMVAGIGLGFGLSAVLLLPVQAYAPVSIRGATEAGGVAYQYATNWSLSPSEIATFYLPSAAGFGEGTYVGGMPFTNFPNYLGQAALLFGVAALLLLRGRVLVYLSLLVLASLAVSFGRNASFFYDLLYNYMPYFNKFRVPVMILVLLQLGASVVAGLGLSALWKQLPATCAWGREPSRADVQRFFVAAVACAILLGGIAQPWGDALATRVGTNPRLPQEARGVYAAVARGLLKGDGLRIAVLLVSSAAAVLLLWRRRLPADAAGAVLVALAVFDLGVVDRRMVQPQHTWPGLASRTAPARAAAAGSADVARWILEQPRSDAAPPRILPPGAGFMNNEWMRHGIASAGGYHPAKLSRFETLVDTRRQTLDPRLADLFGVRWFVLSEPAGQAVPAYEGPGGVVYENPNAMPRAWVTGRYEVLEGGDCGAVLRAPDFDVTGSVILERRPEPEPDPAAAGTARITSFGANRLEVDVTASAPALLVVAEAYHPDWRARVGGEARPVYAADCVLRAVPVPAGVSKVTLEFTSPELRTGLAVTLVSLALVLGFLIYGVAAPRRRGALPGEAA